MFCGSGGSIRVGTIFHFDLKMGEKVVQTTWENYFACGWRCFSPGLTILEV